MEAAVAAGRIDVEVAAVAAAGVFAAEIEVPAAVESLAEVDVTG